ncbi:MAG: lysophospholipid acyltransferase family protein [Dehalococcoidia bacterium]
MVYQAFRFGAWLARAVPVRASYPIAASLGVLIYFVWWGGRRRCVRNMTHVTGGDRGRAATLARRSFANYAVYLVDFLRFTTVTPDEVRRRVVFDEWERLEAQRSGKGIVFVTMHFGNWDLGAAALAEHGIPISVVADTFGDARLNDLVLGARRHLGMEILPAERMGPSILRALHRNNVVAMLIDVPQAGAGVEVRFFDGPVAVADGPARIALRTGASVVAVLLPRIGRSERVLGRIEPVAFTPSGDQEQDVYELTQSTMTALERMLRDDPDQWYIFRNLWVADRKGGR